MSDILPDTYYSQLCENLGVALITTDLDLNIRVWNAAAARTFGIPADRMLGRPINSIMPEDRREEAERALLRVIEAGETIQFEFGM